LIRKYASTGSLLWTVLYDSDVNNRAMGHGVAVDAAGNVIVTGIYDKDGNPQWTWNFDSPSHGFDSALGLAVIPDGSAIAVAGLEQRLDLGQDGNLWVHVLGPCPN
jgi:hypothetical protein